MPVFVQHLLMFICQHGGRRRWNYRVFVQHLLMFICGRGYSCGCEYGYSYSICWCLSPQILSQDNCYFCIRTAPVDVYLNWFIIPIICIGVFVQHLLMFIKKILTKHIFIIIVFVQHLLMFIISRRSYYIGGYVSIRTAPVDVYPGQVLGIEPTIVKYSYSTCWCLSIFYIHWLSLHKRYSYSTCWCLSWGHCFLRAEIAQYSYSTCWCLSKQLEYRRKYFGMYSYSTCWCLSFKAVRLKLEEFGYSYSTCWCLSDIKRT